VSRRRVATLLVPGLVAALALAAPGAAQPASAADDAATIGDETISVEEFEALMDSLGELRPDLAPDPATDTVTADQGRQLLGLMIMNRLRPAFLAEYGAEIGDAELAEADASVVQQQGGAPLPEPLHSEAVADLAYSTAVAGLAPPGEDALSAAYSESPAGVGVMCLNVFSIVGDADDAADALREGTSSRDVVAAAGNGSTVQDRCFSLGELGQLVPGLFHELIELGPGGLLDPIETSSGHQILQVAAFDDISGELANYFAGPPVSPATGETPSAGELLLMGYAVTADVSVNPRYGRWDAATVSIVPLGQP
jgi:hypothetical protein